MRLTRFLADSLAEGRKLVFLLEATVSYGASSVRTEAEDVRMARLDVTFKHWSQAPFLIFTHSGGRSGRLHHGVGLSSSSRPPTSWRTPRARTPASTTGCATRWPAQATASTPRLHRPRQRQRQQLRPLETLSSLLSLDDWFDNLNSRVMDVQSRLLTVDPDLPLAA